MEKIIKVNPFRLSSIQQAIAELEAFQKLLKEFPARYTEAMMNAFKEFLAEEAPAEGIALMKSIDIIDYGDHAEGVVVFDGHVEFIEFGTGIVGLNLHDGINMEWLSELPPPYNIGWNTGTYIIHTGNSDFWYYRNESGKWVATSGIPANPFLYRTVDRLLQERRRIRNEVLSGIR